MQGRMRWCGTRTLCGLVVLACLLAPAPLLAQAPPGDVAADVAVKDLDTVVVSGELPGPGLWRVSRDGRVMWVLGTVSPLPKGLEWRADEVQQAIAGSQAVIGAPGWYLDADVGFFRRLTLFPAAMKAARDPQGRTLREVVPADVHARWLVLKARYIGRDNGVEKDRPVVAGNVLMGEALQAHRLARRPVITPVIEKAARRAGVEVTDVSIKVKVADPRAALKQARTTSLDDTACFVALLDVVERDMPDMVERANAWSVGDIEALQRLGGNPARDVCIGLLIDSPFGRAHGLADVEQRARDAWLQAARGALGRHAQSFASAPVGMLLGDDGLLARLQREGYEVEAPPQ